LSPSTRQTTSATLSAFDNDNYSDNISGINVFFYDNSTGNVIDNVWIAKTGGTATRTWSGLTRGNTCTFYAVGIDNYGGRSYSSDTCSFLVNSLPVDENQETENQTNPTYLTTFTPVLSWDYYDADTDTQENFQIQVGTAENGSDMWDNNQQNSDNFVSYAGTTLSEGVTYYWRVRVYDNYEWSSWLYGGTFRIGTWSLIETWTGTVGVPLP